MYGFKVTDDKGVNLFVPNASCYVHYKTYSYTKTQNGDFSTGLSGSLKAVFFTRELVQNATPGVWNGFNIGVIQPFVLNGVWHIKTDGFTGSVYVFLPGYDVQRLSPSSARWGARFYDEQGLMSFVGTQRPLSISAFIKSQTGTPFNGTKSGNIYHAMPHGVVGQARVPVGSGWLVFHNTVTMYQGIVSYKFLPAGEAPGGGGFSINTGDIPLIDVRNYE